MNRVLNILDILGRFYIFLLTRLVYLVFGFLQEEYKNMEKIGTLNCGHEYHAECLKKWLHVKNVCPICKSEALTTTAGTRHRQMQ